MAHEFPNCTYDGCDIVDVTNKNLDVKQFTFREGNVLHGLPYPDNTFDFVHMRLLVYALREEEWPVAIKEAIRVVKPGGMLQFVESGLKLPEDSSTVYYKFVCASANTSVAKKFRWGGVEFIKSSIHHLKPMLGLESEEDTQRYIKDFNNCMTYSDCCFDTTVVGAKKL
ncbi:hypothetical protein G6F56_006980 [Rhizopus delemar]|nr:hypothetical protein G6F56_006980 [Rhizopus delemar]